MPKNNKTGIVGEEKEVFTFGRKAASASGENSVHLHRNTQLGAEMENHLGYPPHSVAGHHTGNSRNGTSVKTLKGDHAR